MTIYRGFEITEQGNQWFVTNADREHVHIAATEEEALNWVDAEKRRQRQAQGA